MTEHPSIAAMMNSGYEYGEPKIKQTCADCGEGLVDGDDFVRVAGNYFCNAECHFRIAVSEGNIEVGVIGEYD